MTELLNSRSTPDLWFLFRDWMSYPAGDDSLEGSIQKAGSCLATEISKYVSCARVHTAGTSLKRDGSIDPQDVVFQWTDPNQVAPKLDYVEDPVFDYGEANFPVLINRLLLPRPGPYFSVRRELDTWVRGGDAVEAPRAASICGLLEYSKSQNQPDAFVDYLVFAAVEHFREWLTSILEKADAADGIERWQFKAVDAERRHVSEYILTPAEVERLFIEPTVGLPMQNLGNFFSVPLDQIIRKGKLCERENENYTEFADGAIIVNALVNKAMTIAGKEVFIAGSSVGCCLGVVFNSHKSAMEPYALYAHELAHVLFLEHFINTEGQSILFDHDRSDKNCMMSYPLIRLGDVASLSGEGLDEEARAKLTATIAAEKGKYAQRWETAIKVRNDGELLRDGTLVRVDLGHVGDNMPAKVFRPHFCGKCNLKLRGWDIRADNAQTLPGFSLEDLPDKPPFAHSPPGVAAEFPEPQAADVRFIPATAADGAAGDALGEVGISCYPSHKAGELTAAINQFKLNDLEGFPTVFKHEPDLTDAQQDDVEAGTQDPAAFMVEVHEPNLAVDRVYVTIEARKPVYDAQGNFADEWEDFPEEERPERALVWVECRPLPDDPHLYRSRLLRLVVDEADQEALAGLKQGLLVTDMASGDGGPDDAVEILDQQIRVIYDPTPRLAQQ